MDDLWRFLVLIVKQMLKIKRPLFDSPKQISLTVTDGVRTKTFRWLRGVGDMTDYR